MWPVIIRKNKVGIKFEEDFWTTWGPSDMFYFNPELFNDKKDIKSVYFKYLPHNYIEFNPSEIAMGIQYKCEDFGEHTVLFSYEEIPNIIEKSASLLNYYVLPNIETEDDLIVDLYNYKKLMRAGKISETEIYVKYLENTILHYDEDRQSFRKLSQNILNAYIGMHPTIKQEQAYQIFLENIVLKILNSDNSYTIVKSIRECCKNNPKNFDKIIYEIMSLETEQDLSKKEIKDRYQDTLKCLETFKLKNNLNSIFRNCRDLFLDNVIQYKRKDDANELDFYVGKVIKDEKGKAVFQERRFNEMNSEIEYLVLR